MENVTIEDILKFTKGDLCYDIDKETLINNISNDSRNMNKDSLYIALIGENLDGHIFSESALANGGLGAIVQKPTTKKDILVEDTYLALKEISRGYRNRFDIPFVSVTGSSGKTTTKDMMYYTLSKSYNTHRNLGNFNNEVGLPLTLLNLKSEHQCAILEMGMYNLGEIDYLADIVRPNVAVITNVGVAHLETVKTRENILQAKMEIANYMTKKDILIINGDNDLLGAVDKNLYDFKIYTFGQSKNMDFRLINYSTTQGGVIINAKFLDEELEYFLPSLGIHNIMNSISALAVCKVLGLDMANSSKGLLEYVPSAFRTQLEVVGNKNIMKDYYNANPDSMLAAVNTFKDINNVRKVAILADMLELGEIEEKAHREIGKSVAEIFDVLICIGKSGKFIGLEGLEAGMKKDNVYFFENNEEAIKEINKILEPGDYVLIKGSRGMKLEEVADKIC